MAHAGRNRSNHHVDSLSGAIQAIAGRCFAVVRVADGTAENIKRVLDTGCDGIIAPHVNSVALQWPWRNYLVGTGPRAGNKVITRLLGVFRGRDCVVPRRRTQRVRLRWGGRLVNPGV